MGISLKGFGNSGSGDGAAISGITASPPVAAEVRLPPAAPPGPPDPYWANVSLLIQGEDSIIDRKGHAITNATTCSLSSAQSKFGTKSILFPATTPEGHLTFDHSADWNLGGVYTIEGWVYPLSLAQNMFIEHGSTGSLWHIWVEPFGIKMWNDDGAENLTLSNNPVVLNEWTHLAIVDDGTNVNSYLNGVFNKASLSSALMPDGVDKLIVGGRLTNTLPFDGYMEEIRVTKGIARYTSNFTPPTEPFPSY